MKLFASWAHGTALTIESPENLSRTRRYGWGTEVSVTAGEASWFHISVPTPVVANDVRSKLQKVFLLFDASGGRITDLHVYDGSSKIQEFPDLNLAGRHRSDLDGWNTFHLNSLHSVAWGIGISFAFVANSSYDGGSGSKLVVGSAGGDFLV